MSDDPMETPAPHRRCKAMARSTGEQCKRRPIIGGTVCVMHGGAAPAVRAAALRRKAEAEATALLELLWDPKAAPVTNPVTALQELAGRLQHSANVLGARLAGDDLDGPTALAWVRVLRELRQALEGMERLDLAGKVLQLEQDKGRLVAVACNEGLEAIGATPEQRDLFVRVLMHRLRGGGEPSKAELRALPGGAP